MKTHLKKQKHIAGIICINILLVFALGCSSYGSNRTDDKETRNAKSKTGKSKVMFNKTGIGNLNIEEPVVYKNLQLFPITSNEIEDDANYIPLAQALDEKMVTVIETGSVNELSITNKSDNYIFIMAGDIVKGGKQDRTVGEDYVIPPHVEKTPLRSYCVESGRWRPRGEEKSDEFSSNSKVLSSKKLKMASRYEKDQSQVWSNVNEHQNKLNQNLEEETGKQVEVRSSESASSLQLALENEDLEKLTDDYKKAMRSIDNYSGKMIGYVYAINGEIYGADIFGSRILFKELKPKLIEAVITEAISELDNSKSNKQIAREDVAEFLEKAEQGEKKTEKVNKATDVTVTDNDDMILFETTDKENSEKTIRKSYIMK